MIVVADTSPLNYLIQIGCDSVLPALYKRVMIPAAVLEELRRPDAPSIISAWLSHLPEWMELSQITVRPDPALAALDPGEREAIQLAQERRADLLLIDERRGRMEARRRGLATTGTLGVLLSAAKVGLIDAGAMHQKLLTQTNFRSTPELQRTFDQRVRKIHEKR